MNRVILVSAVLSVVLIAACLVVCRRKKQPFGIEKVVNIPLHCLGTVVGVVLVGSLFVPELSKLVAEVAYYAAVGGGAAMFVCISAIRKEFPD